MKLRRGDMALILIALVSVAIWLLWPGEDVDVSTAQVQVGNETVMTIELSQDGIYPVKGSPGAGVLEVKDGKIRMQPMPREICPRGICCRLTGWIESAGKSIVCLPNRIVVTLSGTSQNYTDL